MLSKVIISLTLVLLVLGCSNSSSVEPIGTGKLSGTVFLVDRDGRYISDNSGVHVDVENKNYHTVTASNGNWRFDSLPKVDCTILFSKEGFGQKRGGVIASNADTLVTSFNFIIELAQEPTFTVTFDALIPPNDSVDHGTLFFHTSGVVYDSAQIYLYIITGNNPQIAVEKNGSFTSYFFSEGFQSIFQGGHDRNIVVSVPDYYGVWGLPGSTTYIRAYPVLGNELYIDPLTNRYVTSGYNHVGSNVLSAKR
jgi:hypothetical protein